MNNNQGNDIDEMKYISQRKDTKNYCVTIQYTNNRRVYVGTFKSLTEAKQSRDKKLMELDGNLDRLKGFCYNTKHVPDKTVKEIYRLCEQGYGRQAIQEILNLTDGEADYHRRQWLLNQNPNSELMQKLLHTNEYLRA